MTAAGLTISSGAIKKLLTTAGELGLDVAALCLRIGIDARAADDVDERLPVDQVFSLWEELLARPVTASAAARYTLGDYGLVGFVCASRPNLREALVSFSRYIGLWTDEPRVQLREDGAVQVDYRSTPSDRRGVRCAAEATLVEILQGGRQLITGLAPTVVHFSHVAPALSNLEEFFQAPVLFGRPTTSMHFSRDRLETPLPPVEAQLTEFLRRLAEQALARRGMSEARHLDDVRRMIGEELRSGVPSLAQIARRMAIGERTLRRRLVEEGSSFREVLERTRAELARNYVRDRRLPLSEVAFLVGFSERSAFNRAFKRWHDATPSEYRRRFA